MNRRFLNRAFWAVGVTAALGGCVAPPMGAYPAPHGEVGYTETVIVPPPAYGYGEYGGYGFGGYGFGGYGAYGGGYAYPRRYYAPPGYFHPRPGPGGPGPRPHYRDQPPGGGSMAPPAQRAFPGGARRPGASGRHR